MIALVTGAAAAAGIRRVLAMGCRFPESGRRLVDRTDSAEPAILEDPVKVGGPVVASGDHLLIAEPVRSRSAAG
jgi:hypothetical protein